MPLRAGGTIGFTLYPSNYEKYPVLLTCSYLQNWDLRGDYQDVSYFTANLGYELQGFENVTFHISYAEGEIPTTLEDDHKILAWNVLNWQQ